MSVFRSLRSWTGLAFSAFAVLASGSAGAQTSDTVDRSELKVCADPSNLPFSDDKKEGFENKIAELMGGE
ncbi:MAG: hypothetical protein WCB44_12235, partial [Stellaceae bacterium]